jgi:hypothetical protein
LAIEKIKTVWRNKNLVYGTNHNYKEGAKVYVHGTNYDYRGKIKAKEYVKTT